MKRLELIAWFFLFYTIIRLYREIGYLEGLLDAATESKKDSPTISAKDLYERIGGHPPN